MGEGENLPTAQEAVGFEDRSASALEKLGPGALAVVAREESELKAAVTVAKLFPRNELGCYNKLLLSCERPSFAEGAAYNFPRGGKRIEGPSVELAREAARCWTNMRYGMRVIGADETWYHVKGWALDLESNVYAESEDRFRRLIYRKEEGWIEPDERDARELTNRRGAICYRNAILQILPPDLIDDAVGASNRTLIRAANGEIKEGPEQAARRIVRVFWDLGVPAEAIEKRLGHTLTIITAEEIAELRQTYKAIRDGVTYADQEFEIGKIPRFREPAKKSNGQEPRSKEGENGPNAEAARKQAEEAKAKLEKQKELPIEVLQVLRIIEYITTKFPSHKAEGLLKTYFPVSKGKWLNVAGIKRVSTDAELQHVRDVIQRIGNDFDLAGMDAPSEAS